MLLSAKLETDLREVLIAIKKNPSSFWIPCLDIVQTFFHTGMSSILYIHYQVIERLEEFSKDIDELAEFKPKSSRRDYYAQLVDTMRSEFKNYYQRQKQTGNVYAKYVECEEALMTMSRMTHFQVGNGMNRND